MSHLTLEDLARLVDEAPAEAEALHLKICDLCRAEYEALREQSAALRELPELRVPTVQWPVLEARLRAEGLIARPALRWRGGWNVALRIAAALALFVAGGATGAALWGRAGGGAGLSPVTAGAARSAVEAERAVRATEAAYLEALTRYAELTGAGQAVDPVNRLAALEGIVLTTRAALKAAPADPVINGYHLTALSQREAMLRQISTGDESEWF